MDSKKNSNSPECEAKPAVEKVNANHPNRQNERARAAQNKRNSQNLSNPSRDIGLTMMTDSTSDKSTTIESRVFSNRHFKKRYLRQTLRSEKFTPSSEPSRRNSVSTVAVHTEWLTSFSSRNTGSGDHSELWSIPPSKPAKSLPQLLEEKERQISYMKGVISAYQYRLENNDFNCVSTKLQMASETANQWVTARDIYGPFISDESPLVRSLHVLLDDCSFHCDVDKIIQREIDIQNIRKIKGCVSLIEIKSYEELLYSLQLRQKVVSLEVLQEELQSAWDEIKTQIKPPAIDSNNTESVPPYTRLAQQFLQWKEEFKSSEKSINDSLLKFSFCLDEYSVHFLSLVKGKEKKPVNFSHFNAQELWNPVAHGVDILEKVIPIPIVCWSVLNEIEVRLSKLRRIEKFVVEVKNISPDMEYDLNWPNPNPKEEEGRDEDSCLNLLAFIKQAKKMSPQAKSFIIDDVVKSLLAFHAKGKCYCFLSPQNVLLRDGTAVLCPMDTATIQEPFPPWKFFAPEWDYGANTQVIPSLVGSYVGPAADSYSLGRLIQWLACMESSTDFLERMVQVLEKDQFLRQLLSHDPSQRPSMDEVHLNLKSIFSNVFGYQENDSDAGPVMTSEEEENGGKKESNSLELDSTGHSPSEVEVEEMKEEEERLLRMIAEDENDIIQELQDSDEEEMPDE